MLDGLEKTKLYVEHYKEINASRRHYSTVRFALLPVYFAIQGGIIQIAFKSDPSSISNLPIYFYALAGFLVTYVFWTIEERILQYYNTLENIGQKLEDRLGYNMFSEWPKARFKSDTKKSIRIIYIIVSICWIIAFIYYLFKSFL